MKTDSQDTPVKTYLVSYLNHSRAPRERVLALNYAKGMVAQYPKWAGAYSTLGGIHETSLFLYGDLSAADKAVAAFRKYLSLLPRSDTQNRQRGLEVIQILQKEKARQQKHGFKTPNSSECCYMIEGLKCAGSYTARLPHSASDLSVVSDARDF